jgi:hypothetical protein
MDDDTSTIDDDDRGATADDDQRPPRRWSVRPWLAVATLVVVALAAAGAGVASRQSTIDDVTARRDALAAAKTRVTRERDVARRAVDDRESQRRADEAEAARIAAEQQEAAAKAAADQKAAADKAAAAAAAAEAQKNTIGPGVYEIGADKNPGRYKSDGPTGANPVGCYYAILHSPDTSDIATNNITEGPATVDLAAGTFFESSSCGPWQRVG